MITMSNPRRGLPLTSSRIEKIFPKLTPEQIRRIAAYGGTRSVQPGEVLIEQGDTSVPFFVVITAEVAIVIILLATLEIRGAKTRAFS